MTPEQCVAAGGHHPVWKAGGILGCYAEHREGCSTCSAERWGYLQIPGYREGSPVEWREWGRGPMGPGEYFESLARKDPEGFKESLKIAASESWD